jgi:hypothetical protein
VGGLGLIEVGVGAVRHRPGIGEPDGADDGRTCGRVRDPGPWSLQASRRFWEGFTPAALAGEAGGLGLRTVFCAEGDWHRAEAEVTQAGDTAHMVLAGDGDLDAAAAQVRRFLALYVDGRGWPEVGRKDPVLADAQARRPGVRPTWSSKANGNGCSVPSGRLAERGKSATS